MIERRAGRVLLVDAQDRVLLLRGHDPARPDDGHWWFTPGGGAEPGESFADAARRELAEETGHVAGDLGDPVHHRVAEFDFEGVHYRQTEEFFLVRASHAEVDTARWTEVEVRSVSEWRWFTAGDLVALADADVPVYPEGLTEILLRLRRS